jgi:hypothetical protein
MNQKKEFTDAFAPSIWEYVSRYNKTQSKSNLKRQLNGAVRTSLQKWSDRYPKIVSLKAYKLAKKHKKDLFKMLWKDRKECGVNKKGKSNLVWEHTTPINELIKSLCTCKDLQCIKNTLNNYSGVCWITRNEDDALNKNSYGSKRPGGWKKCYGKCGIILRKK